MDDQVFSLEDEDYGNMFITQESSNSDTLQNFKDKSDDEDEFFLRVKTTDFASPCVSQVMPLKDLMYSDISDCEDFENFEIPSSQNR